MPDTAGGKNAKFSDVVCIGNATHRVLKISTITKENDPCSQRHELIGVKNIYEYFDDKNCPIDIHAHDNNNQITKYVREERCLTENAIDTWHMTKGLAKNAKKITSGARKYHGITWHGELSDKAAAIKTHIYYSMKNSNNDAKTLQNNILNFIEHYQNNHGECLPTARCKTDQNYECSKYILKSEKAISLLTDFIKSLPVNKFSEKYKYCMDTHYVESFNNFLLQYVDKRIVFGQKNYLMRIILSILDWNENVDRESTSQKEKLYKRNLTNTYTIDVKKRKTTKYKETLWTDWIKHVCQQ